MPGVVVRAGRLALPLLSDAQAHLGWTACGCEGAASLAGRLQRVVRRLSKKLALALHSMSFVKLRLRPKRSLSTAT
jgi:hypothetical protein